ncbi:phosphotransferase [Paenibacillus lemnae]|uniref:Phosphotransferase n=2 Tax=Paenibacillus lemnae TaxID=1330551 RepID=A0A848M8U5_PAELE|nr:phosphotransferase [Paenibacillus lemnae]
MIGELTGVGNTAKVYEWRKNEVVKVFYDHESAKHEARNAEIISGLELRTPQYNGLIEIEGQLGIIYEKITGPTMLKQMDSSCDCLSNNARLMARLQFQMNTLDASALQPLQARLTYHIQGIQEFPELQKHSILDTMNLLQNDSFLCHYDFHPDNIIMSPGGPVIIDWLNALAGCPEADVTRTSMMLASSSLPPEVPGWLNDREARDYFHKEYLSEYLALSGLDSKVLEQWMVPTLAARIHEMQGLYREEIVDQLRVRLANDARPNKLDVLDV